ncbi:O-methyltransferase [Tabrizicola aquatica]|uniref:O-methyltransferase n=1 Tax=Tabrizicola aquatica TaxID=909926 RepID=UPI000CD27824|nr:O-methyltransferase [Tabrizicola aquatica]
MASFDSINYSLRPSKSVQRGLVFDGLRKLSNALDLSNAVYIGFGSIWFTDFVLAHKTLNIDDMVSIEANEIGFKRAQFNKSYRTITMMQGMSQDKLPEVLSMPGYLNRPWIVWLDYDSALNEGVVQDFQWTLNNAPPNSVLLFTFSATQNAYGDKPVQRPERLRSLLGDVVPDDLSKEDCSKENLPSVLAKLAMDYLKSEVADLARPGGLIEAFRVPYFDSVGMVTVGAVLPAVGAVPAARAVVSTGDWKCLVDEVIHAPQLTLREIAALQSELPPVGAITRTRVQELGFDLQDEQIQSFQKYYKYLPSFAEVVV